MDVTKGRISLNGFEYIQIKLLLEELAEQVIRYSDKNCPVQYDYEQHALEFICDLFSNEPMLLEKFKKIYLEKRYPWFGGKKES